MLQPLSRTALAALLGAALAACSSLGIGRPGAPQHQWFAFYEGPMRPLEEVAVLCRSQRGTDIATIRRKGDARATSARRDRWGFPECIEVLAGSYQLEVHYFSRQTRFEARTTVTETMESAVPMTVEWVAEAGGLYRLVARLGAMAPATGVKPRIARDSSTTLGRWYVRVWDVEIERVPSWDHLEGPLPEHREAWRRYRDR